MGKDRKMTPKNPNKGKQFNPAVPPRKNPPPPPPPPPKKNNSEH